MSSRFSKIIVSVLATLAFSAMGLAQTTAFNYQGHLTDNGSPATGSFQMQFKLFDSLAGGTQIGPTITDLPVTAAQGIFAARLDFGSNPLSGANRWLEIAVRHNAGEGYTTLIPREQIYSSPYSVRTLSAASADLALDSQKLGGVNSSQFVQTTDSRLSDARNPLPGSSNYVQNTTSLQNATINMSGTLTSGSIFTDQRLSVGAVSVANHKISIFNGIPWTTDNWGGAIEMQNGAAIGWQPNSSGFSTGLGRTTAGLFLFRTQSPPGTTGSAPIYDLKVDNAGNMGIGGIGLSTPFNSKFEIFAQDGLRVTGSQPFLTLRDSSASNKSSFMQGVNGDAVLLTNSRAPFTVKDVSGDVILSGNASQPAGATGLLKYGILVNADGTLNLCFNPANPTSCGITVSHSSTGVYDLTFPAQINSRIFSVTMALAPNFIPYIADEIYARPTSTSAVRVKSFSTYGASQGQPEDVSFYLAVY